jgi:tRNA dimethylallyltransferase
MHLITLLGQTCSGKSDMAVELALELRAMGRGPVWIVNCDSRQIYRHLNLGTGKVAGHWQEIKSSESKVKNPNFYKSETGQKVHSKVENGSFAPSQDPDLVRTAKKIKQAFFYRGFPHFLIDYVDPAQRYSLVDYLADWCSLFNQLNSPTPEFVILTGGTGLYAKAINEEYQPGLIKQQFQENYQAWRERLQSLTLLDLKQEYAQALAENGPQNQDSTQLNQLNQSDSQNPRRLQNWLLRKQASQNSWTQNLNYPKFETKWVLAIQANQTDLHLKIKARLAERVKLGMVEEVMSLDHLGQRHIELGLEYRIIWQYLLGHLTDDQWQVQLQKEIERYAKRQLTWLKKESLSWVGSSGDILKLLN